jgi:RNA polymerase sigma factor (TIGR02999 family)
MSGVEDLGDAFARVYDELRRVARRLLSDERAEHTLEATALVHEAFVKLSGAGVEVPDDTGALRRHAAVAMRRILIDHARSKGRLKRHAGARLPLDAVQLAASGDLGQLLAVDAAIEQLAARDEALAELVRLRFYAGFGVEEIAELRACSTRTVVRDWAYAKAWLHRALGTQED